MTGFENRVTYCLLGLFAGVLIGLGVGTWIDRDRDVVIVEIMQFVEGDKFDLQAHGPVWQTTPPVVRPDPATPAKGEE